MAVAFVATHADGRDEMTTYIGLPIDDARVRLDNLFLWALYGDVWARAIADMKRAPKGRKG